jgi:hypothetical protein
MQTPALDHLARELREALQRGALAHHGRVELSDGVTVDAERMAGIVLVGVERIAGGTPGSWLSVSHERELYDDLLRLLTLARPPVRA